MNQECGHQFCLENDFIHFSLSVEDNTWTLEDKRAGVSWGNAKKETWIAARHGTQADAPRLPLLLRSVEKKEAALYARLAGMQENEVEMTLVFRLNGDALQVYCVPAEGMPFAALDLFESGVEASAKENGDALVPIRMGLLLPAAGKKSFDLHLGTYDYEGVHMAMAGLFKAGAVLMASWGDPYLVLNLARVSAGTSASLHMSFTLTGTARSVQLQCLGRGNLTTLAEAYRKRAKELGYRVTWQEKLKNRPQAAKLFGASNVKLWMALARRIDENMIEKSVEVNWSFDEVAQVAEHLKEDLEMDDVLFHLGGWTNGGYDVRHPDIQPANPECGGDAGLADCVQRVQELGYLFCLHDNYQDIYRDSPSWNEYWLEKKADGSPQMGGVWMGGQAYYTCAREAVRLAQRPQNLPWVRDAFHPDIYFIDTTYAVGPQECFDPRHPLTKQDDIHWKGVLSDYSREVIGMFGSECGREWAVPHADFFEGLTSVSGNYYHMLKYDEMDGTPLPFFDMVFHDCIAIQGKYGYNPADMAEQVIHHVAMGRTLYYHSLGNHLYWQKPAADQERKTAAEPFDPDRPTPTRNEWEELPRASGPYDRGVFTRAHNGWAEGFCLWDRYMKNTHEVLSPLNQLTAQALIDKYEFLDAQRLIRRTTFSNGVTCVVNGSPANYELDSASGGRVVLPPYGFLVEADTFIAFHARSWNGQTYAAPVLFTVTSLDERPLAKSKQVRIFHGFGEARLAWRGDLLDVRREAVVKR